MAKHETCLLFNSTNEMQKVSKSIDYVSTFGVISRVLGEVKFEVWYNKQLDSGKTANEINEMIKNLSVDEVDELIYHIINKSPKTITEKNFTAALEELKTNNVLVKTMFNNNNFTVKYDKNVKTENDLIKHCLNQYLKNYLNNVNFNYDKKGIATYANNDVSTSKSLKNAVQDLTDAYNLYKTTVNSYRDEQVNLQQLSVDNVQDFINELLSNSDFRQFVRDIDAQIQKPKQNIIWQKILNAIKNFFSINNKQPYTIEHKAMHAVNILLNDVNVKAIDDIQNDKKTTTISDINDIFTNVILVKGNTKLNADNTLTLTNSNYDLYQGQIVKIKVAENNIALSNIWRISNITNDVATLENINPENIKLYNFETQHKINNVVSSEREQNENEQQTISTTIAPYYNTQITNENSKEVRGLVQEQFIQRANTIAEKLGIKIKSISTNVGGFTFSEGEAAGQQVTELSYTFELDTQDKNKADLFASIMGEVGHEQQEAVISSNNVANKKDADALNIKIKVKNTKGVVELLRQAGFTDFTINVTKKEISLLIFSDESDNINEKQLEKETNKFINLLKDNYNGTEFKYIESRYIDKQRRKEIYDDYRRENSKIQSVTRGRKSKKTNKSNGYVEGEIRSDGKQDSRNDNNVYTEEITGKELDDYLKDSVKEILQDWGISPSEFELITKPESSDGTTTQQSDINSTENTQSAITKNIVNQLLAHLKSNKFKLHFSTEMKEYLKKYGIDNLQQRIDAGSQLSFAHGVKKPKDVDLYLLSNAIMTQANTFEHLTESLQNDIGSIVKRVIFFGDNVYLWSTENGYEFFIEKSLSINEKNYNKIKDLLDIYETDRRSENLISSIETSGNPKQRSSSFIDAIRREGNRRYIESSRTNTQKGKQNSNSTGIDGNYVDNTKKQELKSNDLSFFTTPQGEIYGFVTKDGEIYLDENVISPEHPIHEYTHLWDRMVQQQNPELWKRGVELMKKTSMWTEIANDIHYGKLWEQQGITGTELEDRIASEVHARFTGEGGAKLLDQIAKEKGSEGIIAKLKDWIKEFWSKLKATFSNWSKEDLDKLTLKDFNHMTVRDFADGVNFENLSQQEQQSQPTSVLSNLIQPKKSVDLKKATAKASIANKFIGFGAPNSSTALYQKQAGEYANVGNYTKDDTVFVSINGKVKNAIEYQLQTIDEAVKAIRSGARLLTDSAEYLDKSSYNTGEKLLAEHLKLIGATYQTIDIDGEKVGQWTFSAKMQATNITIAQLADAIGNENVVTDRTIATAEFKNIRKTQQYANEYNDENKTLDIIKFFKTSKGDIFGFVGKDNKIYLDTTMIDSNTPIHEYTHLWVDALKRTNSKEWDHVVNLMRNVKSESGKVLWDYVKKQYPELKTDSEIAEEVLAHYSGEQGAAKLEKFIEKMPCTVNEKQTFFKKVKEVLESFWKQIAKMLGDIHYQNAQHVADKILYDFANKINPNEIQKTKEEEMQKQQEKQAQNNQSVQQNIQNTQSQSTTNTTQQHQQQEEHHYEFEMNIDDLIGNDDKQQPATTTIANIDPVRQIPLTISARDRLHETMTSEQIAYRTRFLANIFDHVVHNLLHNDYSDAAEHFGITEDEANHLSDMDMIRKIGVDEIFNYIKDLMIKWKDKKIEKDPRITNKVWFNQLVNILDDINFETLKNKALATSLIANQSQLNKYRNGKDKIVDANTTTENEIEEEPVNIIENDNDEKNLVDDLYNADEEIVNVLQSDFEWVKSVGQDGLFKKVNNQVKLLLRGIRIKYFVDGKSVPKKNDFGFSDYMDVKTMFCEIQRLNQTAISPKQLLSRIKEKSEVNPTFEDLYDRLKPIPIKGLSGQEYKSAMKENNRKLFLLKQLYSATNNVYLKNVDVRDYLIDTDEGVIKSDSGYPTSVFTLNMVDDGQVLLDAWKADLSDKEKVKKIIDFAHDELVVNVNGEKIKVGRNYYLKKLNDIYKKYTKKTGRQYYDKYGYLTDELNRDRISILKEEIEILKEILDVLDLKLIESNCETTEDIWERLERHDLQYLETIEPDEIDSTLTSELSNCLLFNCLTDELNEYDGNDYITEGSWSTKSGVKHPVYLEWVKFANLFGSLYTQEVEKSFFYNGKIFMSDIPPSRISDILKILQCGDEEYINQWINENYKRVKWYGYDPKTNTFKNEFLTRVLINREIPDICLQRFRSIAKETRVLGEVLYEKGEYEIKEVDKFTKQDFEESFAAMYKQGYSPLPPLADSGNLLYIKTRANTSSGHYDNEDLYRLFTDLAEQEIDRIAEVYRREKEVISKNPYAKIKNYDIVRNSDGTIKTYGGAKFVFLEALNDCRVFATNNEDLGTIVTDGEKVDISVLSKKGVTQDDFKPLSEVYTSIKHHNGGLYYRIGNQYIYFSNQRRMLEFIVEDVMNRYADMYVNKIQIGENYGIRDDIGNDLYQICKDERKTGYESSWGKEHKKDAIEYIKNYYLNQFYNFVSITQLTVGDLAYFKEMQGNTMLDFAKRFKGVFGRTTRLAAEPNERLRFITLKDEEFSSEFYNEISTWCDELVKQGIFKESDAKTIKGSLSNITNTDGQGLISPAALADVYESMGNVSYTIIEALRILQYDSFSHEQEAKIEEIESITKKDVDAAKQVILENINLFCNPIKPFLQTNYIKPDETGYNKESIPLQVKNSEFLILPLTIVGGLFSKSPKLKALYRIMGDANIDRIQFESAIKVGSTGVIDVSQLQDENEIYNTIINAINNDKFDKKDHLKIYQHNKEQGSNIRISDKGNVVKTIPKMLFGIQVDTTQNDEETTYGSQLKGIAMSNLDSSQTYTIKIGNKNLELNGDEIREIFIALNKRLNKLGYDQLTKRYGIKQNDNGDYILNDKKVNDAIIKDMANGVFDETNLVDGFVLNDIDKPIVPYNEPNVEFSIYKTLASCIKNYIFKQKVKGKTLIQASNFGVSKDLHCQFGIVVNDEKIIINDNWFQANKRKNTKLSQELGLDKYDTYLDWANAMWKSGKIYLDYIDIYTPPFDEKMREALTEEVKDKNGKVIGTRVNINKKTTIQVKDKNGNITTKEVPVLDPRLRNFIGYRIPSEANCSIFTCRVKDFLPSLFGETVMLPAEFIAITGSDFDIDKMFTMMHEHKTTKDGRLVKVSDKNLNDVNSKDDLLNAISNMDKQNINNMLIDTMTAIFANPNTLQKTLFPSSYQTLKHRFYTLNIINNAKEDFEEIQEKYGVDFTNINDVINADIKILEKINDKYSKKFDACTLETMLDIQDNNMCGKQNIGIYAVGSKLHNVLMSINTEIERLGTIQIATHENDELYNTTTFKHMYDREGRLITNNIKEFQASSVDNGKDPILYMLQQNPTTAGMTNIMLLAGYTIDDIVFFFNQPAIIELTKAIQNNLTPGKSFIGLDHVVLGITKVIENSTNNQESVKYSVNNIITDNSKSTLYTDKMYESVLQNENTTEERFVLFKTFYNIFKITDELRKISPYIRSDNTKSALPTNITKTVKYLVQMDHIRDNEIEIEGFNAGNIADENDNSSAGFIQSYLQDGIKTPFESLIKTLQPQIYELYLCLKQLTLGTDPGLTPLSAIKSLQKEIIKYEYRNYNWFRHNRDITNGTFALYFSKLKKSPEYKDYFEKNSFLRNLSVNKNNIELQTVLTADKSVLRERMINDWEDMLYYINPKDSKDQTIPNLALELFVYCFHKSGFQTTSKSDFVQYIPTKIKEMLPGYLEYTENHYGKSITEQNIDDFLDQYVLLCKDAIIPKIKLNKKNSEFDDYGNFRITNENIKYKPKYLKYGKYIYKRNDNTDWYNRMKQQLLIYNSDLDIELLESNDKDNNSKELYKTIRYGGTFKFNSTDISDGKEKVNNMNLC